jgi:hypothetical protein
MFITWLATEARGVSVTQLDSIDPTLVVYKAEATFVGVGLWDLYAAIASPGARPYWDKQHEDATLLEDVNELTELWHFKSRSTWPAKYGFSGSLSSLVVTLFPVHEMLSCSKPSTNPPIPLTYSLSLLTNQTCSLIFHKWRPTQFVRRSTSKVLRSRRSLQQLPC